ncbi:MAG TPA: peptide deformylase [Acidimicrobiia bacterium]|nr:peptide deformylase [Acidimicrobiia bacterium]
MAIFPIRVYPDPVLRLIAAPVSAVNGGEELRRLVDDMTETMYAAPGVGLAAPQIGVSLRVFVFDAGEGPRHVINPTLEETSGDFEYEEGCLSVPGHYWPVERPAYARVRGRDRDGREVVYEGEDLMGRVLQHESDHLDGMLLLSRLGRRERKQALRDLRLEAMERGVE